MQILLPPELDQLVSERLASGQYGSTEEVLRIALELLREREEIIAGVLEGNADYLAGRYCSLEESDARFRQEHGLPPLEK